MAASHKLPLWLRWLGLAAGLLTLIWLPIEDSQITFISILGFIWVMWAAGWILARPSRSTWFSASRFHPIVFSGAMGLTVYPASLFLNILKTGLHGHGYLDLSLYQLRWVLYLSPIWITLGGIFGWVISSASSRAKN